MRKIYSACGAVAAVCVLTFGISAMLQTRAPGQPVPSVQVETDGVSESAALTDAEPQMTMKLRSADAGSPEYIERTISAEDVELAYGYLMDIVAEYGGTVEHEAEAEDSRKVYVQMPGDNAADFISAVDAIGVSAEGGAFAADEAASVGICVMIVSA